MATVALVLWVRDEADIIKENIIFHLNQGVSQVYVADNGSIDGTRDMLNDFPRSEVKVFDFPEHNYRQGETMSKLCRMIKESTYIDWILPTDADEFWYPVSTLFNMPLFTIIKVGWQNMLPVIGEHWTGFRQVASFPEFGYTSGITKVAVKADAFHTIEQGNHDAEVAPRALLSKSGMSLYHYPVRSFEQFERKVRNGGSAYLLHPPPDDNPTMGKYKRMWYESYLAGTLSKTFESILASARDVKTDDTMSSILRRRHG